MKMNVQYNSALTVGENVSFVAIRKIHQYVVKGVLVSKRAPVIPTAEKPFGIIATLHGDAVSLLLESERQGFFSLENLGREGEVWNVLWTLEGKRAVANADGKGNPGMLSVWGLQICRPVKDNLDVSRLILMPFDEVGREDRRPQGYRTYYEGGMWMAQSHLQTA